MKDDTMAERDKLYDQWHGFCRRCHDPRRKDYKSYHDKGITVCPEWRGSTDANSFNRDGFEEYKKWAIAHGWMPGLEIDRINNKHGYRPENCRFVSRSKNDNNRSTNHRIVVNGVVHTVEEWSKINGIPKSTIVHRINDRGWDPARAVTEKTRK